MNEESVTYESKNAKLMTSTKKGLEGKLAPYMGFIRLLLAYVSGLLVGFLTFNLLPPKIDAPLFSYPQWLSWLSSGGSTAIVILFPPLLGVAVAFMRDRRGEPLISRALGRGLLAWAGMLTYWILFHAYIDDPLHKAALATCVQHGIGGCDLASLPVQFDIFIYLLFSGIFVLIAAALTTPVLNKIYWRY